MFMVKKFYTERDIEDMAARGVLSLEVDDNTVLTELAFEKASRLGVTLVQPNQLPPAAPVRPYLSMQNAEPKPYCQDKTPIAQNDEQLRQRIRDAVNLKLGAQIDPALLETIITRVLNNVGIK
jgi:hypothetical protein